MTSIKLDDILDKTHGLYQMANRMNWDYLVNELGAYGSVAKNWLLGYANLKK